MRQLTKVSAPPVLATNAATWAQEYLAARAAGIPAPERWRHKDVLAALKAETFEKCAYCETVIADVAYPHVEHILPKAHRPDLVVTWENLTLGCPKCNIRKRDYYDPANPLLNPYVDDPADHLEFRGPMVLARLDSDMGERSVTLYHLKRPPLIIERSRRIEALHSLLMRWDAADGSDKYVFEVAIHDELSDEREFAATLRAFAESFGFPV